MNKAEELHQKIMGECFKYNPEKLYKNLEGLSQEPGSKDASYYKEVHRLYSESHSVDGEPYQCWFYWYLACATKLLQPKAVVEIGADIGVSALSFLTELPKDGKIYSIDIRNDWKLIPKKEKRIIKIQGNSVDDKVVNKYDYSEATLWLIDGLHEEWHNTTEVEKYKKYWKPGTVVLFDNVDRMPKLYESFTWDKTQDNKVHYMSGFAVIVI